MFLGTQWLYVPSCLNTTATSESPVHGLPYTANTLAITLGAIVQAQATTYKQFKGSYLRIEFTGEGGADAFKALFCEKAR
jgi:hypothetical protein